jgi:glycosyltransferase involved in cell wall biosynthesis
MLDHVSRTNTVREVLFVTSSLDYCGAGRALVHLAKGLQRDRFAGRVVVLGRETPWCDELRQTGVDLDVLGWRRPIDFLGIVNPIHVLNRMLGKRSGLVVAWGMGAVWAAVLGGLAWPSRLHVGAATSSSWPSRLLLRRAGRILALGEAEAQRYRRLGVPGQRITLVAPGVPLCERPAEPATLPGLPDDARLVLCVGPIEQHKGHRDAAWAMDILRLVHPRLHLVILGQGPATDAVGRLVASNQMHAFVHLAGPVADVAPWLARAEVVWVPSLRPAGRFTVLEAMAAGRPVVASDLPELAELVVQGQTGYLVPPGDKVSLARQTRLLLDYPDLARQMGEAGSQRVREHFSLPAFQQGVAAWLES